jgi:nucleotide-binding universal stress UspA family protein
MSAFRKILVPTDFSRHAREAFRVAHDLAKPTGASLVVFHACPPPAPVSDRNRVSSASAEVEARNGRDDLPTIPPKVPVVRVEHEMVVADRLNAKHILRIRRKRGCDLIVIGTRVQTGQKHRLLGSVTDGVVRTADCPVIVVTAPARKAGDSTLPLAEKRAARVVS